MTIAYDRIGREYPVQRKELFKLVRKISEFAIRGPEFAPTLKLLGRLQPDGSIPLDNEDQVGVLVDAVIYRRTAAGRSELDRFAVERAADLSPGEQSLLETMRNNFYAVLRLVLMVPGIGAHAVDLLRGEEHFLADAGLSRTGRIGFSLAGRMIRCEGYIMTTGASLIVTPPAMSRIQLHLAGLGKTPAEMAALSATDESDLALAITRICMDSGGSDDIRYTDVRKNQEMPTSPFPGGAPRRNDPCPCRSGKKYKHCCGR